MSLTPKENFYAIMHGEQPDYYGSLKTVLAGVQDPLYKADVCPRDGFDHPDTWGSMFSWPMTAPGSHPHITPENAVIKDITHWRDNFKTPDIEHMDFTEVNAAAAKVDRNQHLVSFTLRAGLFERSHHLQGIQTALVNYLEYPEETAELLRAITDHKKAYIRMCAENFHPDIIYYHDDWGSKQNLFLPPRVWRKLIKPLQHEISDTIHDCGMIYMHHADCICQPIVEDMVDIGIDIWQGAIAQNDIPEIQRITKGKLAITGGIDGPTIDAEDTPEEVIRAEVRRAFDMYCGNGAPFFPEVPGRIFRERNVSIVNDEIEKYGRIYAETHRK